MTAPSLCTSAATCLRKTARLASASLLFICLLWSTQAAAQTCPAPWNTAANVYGIVFVEGTGNGNWNGFTQSVNQYAVTQGKLPAAIQGSCIWEAIPLIGIGQMKSSGQYL